jgi:hypothetical protein
MDQNLFASEPLYEITQAGEQHLKQRISELPREVVVGSQVASLAEELIDQYLLDVPRLHEDRIEVSEGRDRFPLMAGWRVGFTTEVTRIRVHIPFEGNPRVFSVRPSNDHRQRQVSLNASPTAASRTAVFVSRHDVRSSRVHQKRCPA